MTNRAGRLAFAMLGFVTVPVWAQQPAWEVSLEADTVVASTITAVNRCRTKHVFEISYEGPPFVSFPEATAFRVRSGRQETVPVLFDLTGMGPGTYEGTVVIQCTDCASEPGCTQDRDLLPIVLTIPGGEAEAAEGQGAGMPPDTEPGSANAPASSEAQPADTSSTEEISTVEAAATAAVGSTGKTPCDECVDAEARVTAARAAFDEAFEDPLAALQRAIDAAAVVGEATAAAGAAQAAAREAILLGHLLGDRLERWDTSFNDRQASRRAAWIRNQGAVTDYFERFEQRKREQHAEATAELRAQLAVQAGRRAAAEEAAAEARRQKAAAQDGFQEALQAFIDALAGLRAAKDTYAAVVVAEHCCFPCELLRDHWANLARLRDLLDRLREMLATADQRAAGLLDQARADLQQATAEAEEIDHEMAQVRAERDRILDDLRNAVDELPNCISLEPHSGWSHTNLLSMNNIRVSPGIGMVWRHEYKDEDLRVYYAPGCIRELTTRVSWGRVEQLNRRMSALRDRLADLERRSLAAERAQAEAQAAVDGLEAERQVLQLLLAALQVSGLEANTEAVLDRLQALGDECIARLREEVDGIREAHAERREAERERGLAEGRRAAQERRAERLRRQLEGIDGDGGEAADRDEHDRIRRELDELRRQSEASAAAEAPKRTAATEPPPRTLEEAARQRSQAEEAAQSARRAANETAGLADRMKDELDDLADRVQRLAERVRAWAEYRQALERYRRCLRAKQEALEALQALQGEQSGLQELADRFGEAADALEEGSGGLDPLSDLGAPGSREVQDRLDELAGAASRLGRAVEILDGLMRNQDLSPSERLDVIRKAYDELREWLPEVPGVDHILDYYSSALEAVVEALDQIEQRLTEIWVEIVVSGAADADMAPAGIRDEVRRLAEIHRLTRIVSRDCGPLPQPPE